LLDTDNTVADKERIHHNLMQLAAVSNDVFYSFVLYLFGVFC